MRTFLRSTGAMALAVLVAMTLASAALLELTVDRTYLWLGLPLIIILMLISVISRRFSIHPGLIHLWQLLALAGSAIGLGTNLKPGGGNPLQQVWDLLLQGVLHVQTESAPMGPDPGSTLLLVLLVGMVTVIADILVLTLGTPAWVIAPLLTLYLIPALALKNPVHWWAFALVAASYLVVLAADTARDLSIWTRNLRRDNAKRDSTSVGVWSMATLIGAPVLALSLLAGNAMPTFGSLDLQSKRPRGVGPIQMQDPTIELHRNLAQQSENVMLTYSTSKPEGEYLRLASLTNMEADSWKLTAVQLRDGELTPPPGLSGDEPKTTTRVQVKDFGSQYLPAPYAPTSFEADGPWAHDPISLMILSTAQNNADATRNLSYTVTSASTDPDPVAFSTAKVGSPTDVDLTTKVPGDVPKEIVNLTAEVTQGAESPVLKAAAIQAWLRDPRRYTYSTSAPSGDGFDVIRNFLLEDKTGYCIHFASSMALMARISGIPSRVAVGFLPGTQKGNQWEVRGKEMHAWPELYFEGFGWVRFEPTAGVADAPAWTVVRPSNQQPSASAAPTQSASANPSSSPSASPSQSQSQAQSSSSPSQGGQGTGGSAFPMKKVLIGTGIALGVVVLLLLPMLARTLVRRGRFAGRGSAEEQVEALWAEVRDTMRDIGVRWPQGSPLQKAASLGASTSEPVREALGRIAVVVERARYSRGLASVPESLAKDVRFVTADVQTQQTFATKMRARLLPVSLAANLFNRH